MGSRKRYLVITVLGRTGSYDARVLAGDVAHEDLVLGRIALPLVGIDVGGPYDVAARRAVGEQGAQNTELGEPLDIRRYIYRRRCGSLALGHLLHHL